MKPYHCLSGRVLSVSITFGNDDDGGDGGRHLSLSVLKRSGLPEGRRVALRSSGLDQDLFLKKKKRKMGRKHSNQSKFFFR